jgi:hypothetical protein
MSKGNKVGAVTAWNEVKALSSDWENNRVLQRLDQRIFAMPEKAPTPPPAAPPEDPIQTTGGDRPDTTVSGEIATPEQPERPTPVAPDSVVQSITGKWESFAKTPPFQRPATEKAKPLVTETDRLLRENRLHANHLGLLQTNLKRVLDNVNWDDYDHMGVDNNYGHLYALNYKIEQLLKKTQ